MDNVVVSLVWSFSTERTIPSSESTTSAIALVDSGTIESSRSDVNSTAQRMTTNSRSRSRGFCQSWKPISSSMFSASSNSGSSPSVISET